jgi:ubiquinone/menaquinone biosynthesis C-methylase UbiE
MSAARTGKNKAGQKARCSSYEILAQYYDAMLGQEYAHAWQPLLAQWARRYPLRGKKTLDLAAGTGESARGLLKFTSDLTLLDRSRAMLDCAREKFPGLAMHCGDMRKIKKNGSHCWEWLVCVFGILHYLKPKEIPDFLSSVRHAMAHGKSYF